MQQGTQPSPVAGGTVHGCPFPARDEGRPRGSRACPTHNNSTGDSPAETLHPAGSVNGQDSSCSCVQLDESLQFSLSQDDLVGGSYPRQSQPDSDNVSENSVSDTSVAIDGRFCKLSSHSSNSSSSEGSCDGTQMKAPNFLGKATTTCIDLMCRAQRHSRRVKEHKCFNRQAKHAN